MHRVYTGLDRFAKLSLTEHTKNAPEFTQKKSYICNETYCDECHTEFNEHDIKMLIMCAVSDAFAL